MALTRLGPNQSVNLASNVTGTLPAANLPTGTVIQVVGDENAVVSDYTGTEGTEYDITESGTWETSITMKQGNKLFMTFHLNTSKDSEDANYLIRPKFKVDSGSYGDIANPASSGSRRSCMIGGARAYDTGGMFINPIAGNFLWTPTISGSTGVVTVKFVLVQTAGGNRRVYINYSHNTTDESMNGVCFCNLMEIEA
tara:strand:+ start:153 stop:743 length:591 start_codon:yes stop_codon:yes gene_type:complete